MVNETQSNVNTAGLAACISVALKDYPGAVDAIREAAGFILAGKVVRADVGVFVESARAGQWYHVRGSTCSCPKNTPYCAARFAARFVHELADADKGRNSRRDPLPPGHYHAILHGLGGGEIGTAHDLPLLHRVAFFSEDHPEGRLVLPGEVTMLGDIEMAAAQKAADGDLVKKVCGY